MNLEAVKEYIMRGKLEVARQTGDVVKVVELMDQLRYSPEKRKVYLVETHRRAALIAESMGNNREYHRNIFEVYCLESKQEATEFSKNGKC